VSLSDADGFIEAGAKDGGASRRATSEVGLADVVAFEANPYTYKRFHRGLVEAGVVHENLALSDVSREVEYFADDPAVSFAMWFDVEGPSSQVLRGACELLTRTTAVFIKVENRGKWDGQEWLHHDVIRFLSGCGLPPVARDTQSRHQFNVLFVSDVSLAQAEISEAIHAWRDRSSGVVFHEPGEQPCRPRHVCGRQRRSGLQRVPSRTRSHHKCSNV
jgi:hypothetical protein